jgi:peroxiredoxin 2/4
MIYRTSYAIVLSAITLGASLFITAQETMPAKAPQIGDKAPAFVADSTKGVIRFPEDYKGKWVIFFSHPADFTPVCATEFKRFASLIPEFKKLNAELLGLSVDSKYTHAQWIRRLEAEMKQGTEEANKITFPVVSDTSKKIANQYNMIHPNENPTQTVRSVYFIDPKGTVRAIFYYPIANGRNFDEIMRLLIAMQTSDQSNVVTPANWEPGDKAIPKELAKKEDEQERIRQSALGKVLVEK